MVRKLVRAIPVALRVLFGALLVMSGWTWLNRPDMGGYLADAIATLGDAGRTFDFYRPFLETLVLPNASTFALLVGLGELLSGISLLMGVASRLGAVVVSFQFLNYGLMGGAVSLLSHAVLIAVMGVTIHWKAGRRFGLDGMLHRRWPGIPIW